MKYVSVEFNNSIFYKKYIHFLHFIFTENIKIVLFIHIYYNYQISVNIIHIWVINQLFNIVLIKIIQKVRGQMILCPRPSKELGDITTSPPPPSDARDETGFKHMGPQMRFLRIFP